MKINKTNDFVVINNECTAWDKHGDDMELSVGTKIEVIDVIECELGTCYLFVIKSGEQFVVECDEVNS